MGIVMGKDYCPSCGALLDQATPLENGARPAPGDISICLYCAEVLMYSADFALVKYPTEQFLELPIGVKQQIAAAQTLILQRNLSRS